MQEASNNMFKSIIDSVPGLVYQMRFRKDGSRYWTYLSPAGLEMLGLKEDMIGQSDIAEHSSEKERKELLKSISRSINTLTKWEYDFYYTKPSGDKIWLHCTGMPVKDGDEVCMNGVLLDITEKKSTEFLLKESEEKFTKAFSRTPNPAYITTIPDGVFVEVNESFCLISGYSRDELLGKSVLEFNFYRSVEDRDRLMKQLARDKKLADYKIKFRIKSGEFRDCSVYSEMIEVGGSPALVTIVHDQTEQNKAEKALRSSETLYRSLVQNASDGILLIQDYITVQCNPRALDMLGFSDSSELLGKSPAEFSPEYQPSGKRSEDAAKRHLDSVLKGEHHFFEWLHKKADGTEFYAEINLSSMILEDEKFVLAFMRDISARKKVEEELIDLQVYLQLQIERMPIGLIIWDPEFRVKSWNPMAEKIFGYSEKEAIGKHPYEFIVPGEVKDEIQVILSRLLEGDESANNTNDNLTKSGDRVTCAWSNIPLKKSDGEIIGVLSMVQDVSEQKRAESELKTYQNYLEELVRERTIELEVANASLDERERTVRLLSEITSASNLSEDPEEAIFFAIERLSGHTNWPFGHMVYVNESEGDMTQSGIWYSSDELKDVRIVDLLKNCRFDSEECPVLLAIKTRRPQLVNHSEPYGCELIKHLINDHGLDSSYVFPVEIDNTIVGVVQFLFKESGLINKRYDEIASQIGIQLGMAIQRKRIGNELVLEKSRAEEANKSKSQFLANMSHEIRTPMNSILGFADILSTRVEDEKDRTYLESIRSSGKSLMQILNDILDLSKVEAGKIQIEQGDLYLASFFSDIIDLFKPKIEDKGLSLKINIDKRLPSAIVFDKLRLRQIIINLMSNAVKFTDKGEIIFSVEVIRKNKGTLDLRISIEDTGVGISDDFKEHIFETFTQEDGDISRKYEGTGLGLAITKRLVDILKGEFLVESEKGEGSTFTILLNKVEICKEESGVSESKTITPEMIRFVDKKVLLVEDNTEDQNFFNDLMLNVGLEVKIAAHGREAMQILKSFSPDIILTDIRMPLMDGFELLTKLKANKSLSAIPVIAITASAMKEDIEQIERFQFSSYLLKPVRMNDFYKSLMSFIEFEELIDPDALTENSKNIILDDEILNKLPAIIDKLESGYKNKWEKIRKKQAIDQVQKFGQGIEKLGKDNKLEILRNYGESLLKSVDSFNVEAIKKDISYYPQLVNHLKSLIK